jgi:glycosyltransferase involved in cell wall biosynthesis
MADFYSAECIRDYELAREFGFAGTSLPLVPNSTTFSEEHFRLTMSSPKERHQIIMKCYGATFGYGNILLQIAHSILLPHEDLNIYAYSVTDELIQQAEKIRIVFGNRFKYTTLRAPVTHEKILDEFSRSRIYIGASKSDGISTSFLEALATGAFPIQTSTSCAGEWVNSGALAGIVQPSKLAIEEKLEECIKNYDLLEKAQAINFKLAEERLSYSRIAMITQNFYA